VYMQSSPGLHKNMFDSSNDRYFNALTIDPNATYPSAGFKAPWDAAQDELGAATSLHKLRFYFAGGTRLKFLSGGESTWYRDQGVQRKGLTHFDFNIDYEGNVKPWIFYN